MAVLYRSITREMFGDEQVLALSPLARWLLLACFIEADRAGRLEWRLKTLKLKYLPGDACDIDTLSTELIESGLVVPYIVGDRTLAYIPRFGEFQAINNKEKQSTLPGPQEVSE